MSVRILGLVLIVSATAFSAGSWMKQVSGIGRGNSYDRALDYAKQNLEGEIADLVTLCGSHKGEAEVAKLPQPHCRQLPFNWECTVVGKVTCRFQ